MEITAEDLREWQAALKSGAIKQIKGYLNQPGKGMCCLGVFCYLQKDKLKLLVRLEEELVIYDEGRSLWPERVRDAFNVDQFGPKIPIDVIRLKKAHEDFRHVKGQDFLYPTTLNDKGYTFEEIADLLPYGCTIIDNYTDRNVIKPYGEPWVE